MQDNITKMQADGNKEVQDMFREWLAAAEEGTMDFAMVIGCEGPMRVGATAAGAVGMEYAANFGLDTLKMQLFNSVFSKQVPNQQGNITSDYAIYNLAKAPVTYDFIGWLVDSEMARIRDKAPAPLKVIWYWGKDNNPDLILDAPWKKQMFEQICRPALKLIGAVEETEKKSGRYIESVSQAPVVKAYRNGESVPRFTSPYTHKFAKPTVTITLREAIHYPHKNSNLPEWLKLADWLKEQGMSVVFIRDTEKADEPLEGQITLPEASKDLLMRVAVYNAADCNLFVSNGPAMLALYMDKPWLMFNELQEDGRYKPNTTKGWLECVGIEPGTQFPWCTEKQRIVWKTDTFENMRDAYKEIIQETKPA